ncbi:MAG TPA: HAMP domain-containing histidine kinase [Xanthomonadaceae bacterium]|nr:HAMP domain-containing histidine kinase [Xanthomonadaceae bacterium]
MMEPMTLKPYNLLRSFSILSLLSIVAISAISATLLARFLRENLLQRDAVVTMQFVQSIAQAQNTGIYFAERDDAKRKGPLTDFLTRIAHMPDVVRANVYSRQRTILWSNEEHLIGKHFTDDNPELDRALAGELALETGQVKHPVKTEHILFAPEVDEFVENYIPIRDPRGGAVVGVVEIYKLPRVLMQTIAKGNRLVWLSALLGGLFLYGALFWIVRRASLTIQRQQQALVEAEKWAVIGELTAAVAHSLRNPLAVIRSSAELAQEEGGAPVGEYMAEIIARVDHLEKWVRELLIYSYQPGDAQQMTPVTEVLRNSLDSFARRAQSQAVTVDVALPEPSPWVRGDPNLLAQALNSLIANALEAMPNGGRLRISGERRGALFALQLSDTGVGIPPEKLVEVFKPLITDKRNGLGVGLALARRIVQRCGGQLELRSQQGRGATALLQLPMTR